MLVEEESDNKKFFLLILILNIPRDEKKDVKSGFAWVYNEYGLPGTLPECNKIPTN